MSIKLVFGVLIIYDNYAHRGIAKLIRHGILTPTFAGLSPATPANNYMLFSSKSLCCLFLNLNQFIKPYVSLAKYPINEIANGQY